MALTPEDDIRGSNDNNEPAARTKITTDEPMLPKPYRVQSVIRENHDTVTLALTPLSETQQCITQPGQFNMLYLFGTGEIPISISKLAGPDQPLLHTIRGVGPVSKKCLTLSPGDMIGLRGGFGVGWPLAGKGENLILVAGGIGLAPLRPVIHLMLARPELYGKLTVIYGARNPRDQIFLEELKAWAASDALTFLSTVDLATDSWHGRVGVVTDVMEQISCTPNNTRAFLCGPEVMMHFSVLALEKLGIRADDIYISMERNMKCAIGHCGHCQWGGDFMCKDGPVFDFSTIATRFHIRNY